MNLVAKEMMICNPNAALILSTGAGTEVQLGSAGFYSQDKQFYHRVEDISKIEVCLSKLSFKSCFVYFFNLN